METPRLLSSFVKAGRAAGLAAAKSSLGGTVFGKHSLLTLLRDTPSQGTGRAVVRMSDLRVFRVLAVTTDIALRPNDGRIIVVPLDADSAAPMDIPFDSAIADGWCFAE